jgi:hypothetical protein
VSWRRSATSGTVRIVGTGSRPRPALRLSAWEAEAAFSSSIAEMIMRRSARRSCRSVRGEQQHGSAGASFYERHGTSGLKCRLANDPSHINSLVQIIVATKVR